MFIPSYSGLLQPLDIQFFRGHKSSLYVFTRQFAPETLLEDLTMTDSYTVDIGSKNSWELYTIFTISMDSNIKYLINTAFSCVYIRETISKDGYPGRLKIFMETNKKIMWYHDRIFIIPTEEKRIKPFSLDFNIAMSDKEDISDDTEIRFRTKNNTILIHHLQLMIRQKLLLKTPGMIQTLINMITTV